MAKKTAGKNAGDNPDDLLATLSYEEKESRLDEILVRLDN